MHIIPSTEFAKNFGMYREMVQHDVIAVTSHDRITGYFVSKNDFDEYNRLKALMPKAYAIEELSEETIRAIAASKMDGRHDHLNDLMD